MLNDKRIKNKVVRRVLLIGSFKLLVFSAIIGRLYKLQVVDREKYKTLSDSNRISLVFHAPSRGKIIDSLGNTIANNRKVYALIYDYSYKDFSYIINKINSLIDLNEQSIDIILNKIKNVEVNNNSIVLKEYLSWKELSIIYVNLPDLPGVRIKTSSIREYTKGSYYAHTVGYTSYYSDNSNKIGVTNKMPFFLKGKNGIEKTYDSYLRGVPGREEVEVNASGKYIRRLSLIKSIAGKDVQLTINSDLQDFTHNIIGSNIGAALVLDAKNGDILCSVSSPSFDPNIFSKN